MCEAETLRVLDLRSGGRGLVLCDDWFYGPSIDIPPTQPVEPPRRTQFGLQKYPAGRLVYASMHLQSPGEYYNPLIYQPLGGQLEPLDISNPVTIAILNLAPELIADVSNVDGRPQGDHNPYVECQIYCRILANASRLAMPNVYEAFCLASYWNEDRWSVPPKDSELAHWLAEHPAKGSVPQLVADNDGNFGSEDLEEEYVEGMLQTTGLFDLDEQWRGLPVIWSQEVDPDEQILEGLDQNDENE